MGCGFSTRDDLACWFGNLSAFIYFLCNFPQLYLNFKRRSTKGFSNTFVIMKIFGLSFLVANSAVEELPFPIQLAGILLLFTSVISTIQIAVYNRYYSFLLWLSLPFIVLIISYSCPNTIEYSKWINPAISLISYIPFYLHFRTDNLWYICLCTTFKLYWLNIRFIDVPNFKFLRICQLGFLFYWHSSSFSCLFCCFVLWRNALI